tara:strand:- start:269 stop:550 length:282 start_codon:yes stop_codon:yes gene_type:complete
MPRFNNVNGVNVQFTSAEETARDAEEATWAAGANTRAAVAVRGERDAKLAACDWMGNNDVTMPSAWITYRAALRNVPAQAGFPNSITWPTEPS